MGQDWTRTTWIDRRASPSTHAAKTFDRRGVDFLYSRNMLTRPEWQVATKFECLARKRSRLEASTEPAAAAEAKAIGDALISIKETMGDMTFDVLLTIALEKKTVAEVATTLVSVLWEPEIKVRPGRQFAGARKVMGPPTKLSADTIARTRIPSLLGTGLAKLAEHWEAAKMDVLL